MNSSSLSVTLTNTMNSVHHCPPMSTAGTVGSHTPNMLLCNLEFRFGCTTGNNNKKHKPGYYIEWQKYICKVVKFAFHIHCIISPIKIKFSNSWRTVQWYKCLFYVKRKTNAFLPLDFVAVLQIVILTDWIKGGLHTFQTRLLLVRFSRVVLYSHCYWPLNPIYKILLHRIITFVLLVGYLVFLCEYFKSRL